MSHQITKVDLIPNGELSVCNVSQFDNGRVLPFEILENKEAYTFPNDIRVELHCRKADGNIVTLPSESISNNIVTFLSTTQLTACYGKNVCEIALYGPDDYLIGSGNFILDVEKSPTLGGINSTTAIHNLEEQIRDIAEDVIPEILPDYLEDYYTKSEVDALIDNIFPTFTASGPVARFITALQNHLVSLNTSETAETVALLTDDNVVNYFKGLINGSYGFIDLGAANWNSVSSSSNYAYVFINERKAGSNCDYIFTKPDTTTRSRMNSGNLAFLIYFDVGTYNNTDELLADYAGRYLIYEYAAEHTPVTRSQFTQIAASFGANGDVLPVSEALTLTTYSGVNNVFADVGNVTVGYKYMPMPETPNNSNRLLLSSVNSDIIKEKSEIKEQSDIIEDIERGEKNE